MDTRTDRQIQSVPVSHIPRFFFDFVDPASFVVEARLRRVEASLGLQLPRHPYELVVPPDPMIDPDGEGWTVRWESAHGEAAADGLPELRRPTLVPWSRKAHELSLYAREQGVGAGIHDALFDAFHLEGRDIGRVDVLLDLAGAAGLDRSATKAVLDVDRYLEPLRALRGSAERLGARGVPTILAEDRVPEGIPAEETIREALRRHATG